MRLSLLAALMLALAGCGFFMDDAVYSRHLDGPWYLRATNSLSDAMVVRCESETCSGDSLPEPTVFAAGSNDRYVVLAANQNGFHGGETPAYYYVIRRGEDALEMKSTVHGPLTQAEFGQESKRLKLPELSTVIDELR